MNFWMNSKTKLILPVLFSVLSLFLVNPSQARTFRNAYITFEMLDSWSCSLEQTEWVCRSEDPQEAKEAVIILTAKEKGPTDTFPIYERHLNSSITTTSKSGQVLTSKIVYNAQQNKYNDQLWLDGLHMDSEVKNYYTRYLATIKDQIAILVTFSAHNRFYAKHSAHFVKTIQSLRVIASKDLLSRPDLGPIAKANERLGPNINRILEQNVIDEEDPALGGKKKGALTKEMMMGLGILLLALIGYIGYRIYSKRNDL